MIRPKDAADPEAVPVPCPGVETAYLDGEAVLYQVATAKPILLNVTASAVWMLLDAETPVAGIARELADVFSADPEAVQRDVAIIVERFGEMGLLAGVEAVGDPTDAHGQSIPFGGVYPSLTVP
jgi:hypothetical protein